MKTKIKIFNVLEALEVIESYGTVKNRLFRSELFVEVTSKQGKITLAKSSIEHVRAIQPMQKTKVTKSGKPVVGTGAKE